MKRSVFSEGTWTHKSSSSSLQLFQGSILCENTPIFSALIHSWCIFLLSQDQFEPTSTVHFDIYEHLFIRGIRAEFSLQFSHQAQNPFSSHLSQTLFSGCSERPDGRFSETDEAVLKMRKWTRFLMTALSPCPHHCTPPQHTLTFFSFYQWMMWFCVFFVVVYKRKQMCRKFPL